MGLPPLKSKTGQADAVVDVVLFKLVEPKRRLAALEARVEMLERKPLREVLRRVESRSDVRARRCGDASGVALDL
jgi:hypothetical protein